MAGTLRETPNLGIERLCVRCQDWWPDDEEFFNPRQIANRQDWCRACTTEWWREHHPYKRKTAA